MSNKDFETVYKNLGPTIKRLRTEKGITQVELGKMTDKPQSTIARLESTSSYDATLRTLHELISPLEISLSELFCEVEGKSISKLSKVSVAQSKKSLAGYPRFSAHKSRGFVK